MFDCRLTFKAYVKCLKTISDIDKAFNMLRIVGHTGAKNVVLLRLYCGLVHSELDYDCSANGSASNLVLRTL